MKKDRSSRWVVAVFGDSKRDGGWHGTPRVRAVAVFGDAVVDLRGSDPSGPEVVVATAVFGDVKVLPPEGCTVELSGFGLLGDNRNDVAGGGAPTARSLRVKGRAMFGDVRVC